MTEDKELLNIIPFDLTALRNLLLYYILLYFNLNTNNIVHTFSNLNYIDNFLCYGEINVNNGTIGTSYTFPTGYNSVEAGDITISGGVTVTVPSTSRWVIV